jgi:hypothetical protein
MDPAALMNRQRCLYWIVVRYWENRVLLRTPAGDGNYQGVSPNAFEFICCQCGGHPYLDYREVPPRLQQIRGPHPMEAGLAAYEEHLG